MIDLSRAKKPPFAHQVVGVERLVQLVEPEVGRIYPGCFLLADEMRLGKTYQVINTAQILFQQGDVRVVIVVAPSPVRDVWFDPDLGEIRKHRWDGLPTLVTEYHQTIRKWAEDTDGSPVYLTWIVTNYEYIRYNLRRTSSRWTGPHLEPLLKFAGPRTMLVLDESSAIANYESLQTRACMALRAKCGRVIELNGTPFIESPEDFFSQAKVLDKRIFGMDYISQYRARYAVMFNQTIEKWNPVKRKKETIVIPQVLGWRHAQRPGCCEIPEGIASPIHGTGPGLEEIQERMAPYILRRMRKDCLDIPPKLDPVTLTARLTPETWRVYREMRDELVAWLDQNTVATAEQAGNKVMRLAQICSGFLGGLRDEEAECPECGGTGYVTPSAMTATPGLGPDRARSFLPDLNLEQGCLPCRGTGLISAAAPPREVGREKLDVYLGWVRRRLREDPNFRMITWCRFRPELFRVKAELEAMGGVEVRAIHGGQKREERQNGLRLMHPDTPVYEGAAILLGTLGTGAQGLNMAGAHEVVYLTNNPSLLQRSQSEDRPHGPGQTSPISYHDVIAVGPKGQKTVEHDVVAALRSKKELATWTCSAWVSLLRQEEK